MCLALISDVKIEELCYHFKTEMIEPVCDSPCAFSTATDSIASHDMVEASSASLQVRKTWISIPY